MFSKTMQPTLINLLSTICHTILSQNSVKIAKIPCHSKDTVFSIKCALFYSRGKMV